MANLTVDTRYPIPWIVWRMNYEFSVPPNDFFILDLPHNLLFTPLLIGQWSTNANFNPSYDLTINHPGGATGGDNVIGCMVSADANNIIMIGENYTNGAVKFYLRLMAFAPPDYTGDVSPVDYASPFRYNSKYNYQKIFMQGRSSAQNVQHSLGYLPQARLWTIANNRVYPSSGTLSGSALTSDSTDPFYYHIYLDPME